MVNFGGQKVKGQGYMRLKIGLEACRRHHSPPCWVEWAFLVYFKKVYLVFYNGMH